MSKKGGDGNERALGASGSQMWPGERRGQRGSCVERSWTAQGQLSWSPSKTPGAGRLLEGERGTTEEGKRTSRSEAFPLFSLAWPESMKRQMASPGNDFNNLRLDPLGPLNRLCPPRSLCDVPRRRNQWDTPTVNKSFVLPGVANELGRLVS